MVSVGIHHGGFPEGVHPLESAAVFRVYMAVEEKFRLVFFHQGAEDLKPPVGQVLQVVDMVCGGMGYQDVKALVAPQL